MSSSIQAEISCDLKDNFPVKERYFCPSLPQPSDWSATPPPPAACQSLLPLLGAMLGMILQLVWPGSGTRAFRQSTQRVMDQTTTEQLSTFVIIFPGYERLKNSQIVFHRILHSQGCQPVIRKKHFQVFVIASWSDPISNPSSEPSPGRQEIIKTRVLGWRELS